MGKVELTKPVLLLNATFEPVAPIPVRRAVVLMQDNKVAALETTGGTIRSASTCVPEPAVVRLVEYVKIPHVRRIPLNTRSVLIRDDYRCGYCGKKATTTDHIVPRSRHGKHVWENVVAACKACNSRKADKLLEELPGWTLRVKPHAPTSTHWVLGYNRKQNPLWEPYLSAAASA